MKKNIIFLFFVFFAFTWHSKAQVTTFPWNEDFEGATFPPTGWVKELPGSGNDITQNSDQNHTTGGQYSARFSSYSNSADYNQYLFSEQIHVTAPYTRLTFWHRKYNSGTDILEWGISTTGQSSADVTTWTAVNLSDADWQQEIIDISSYVGQDIYIAWHYYGNYQYYVYLDDIMIEQPPACSDPGNLTASNITSSQADLSWTEYGNASVYNIELGLAGFTPTGNATNSGVSNPFTVTGLNSNTAYDYYVQADCAASGGAGTSNWVGPYTFSTSPGCGDTFYDDGGPNGDYSANLNQSFTIYPDNAGDVVYVTFNSFDTEQGWDGMMVYNGVDTSAPIFDSGSTYGRPTCPDGAWTGSPGDTYTANGHTFISTDASGALTFVFTADGSGQHAGWEAVVSCAPPPSCPDPDALSVSFPSTTEADLSWTENGSATTWNIEYGPAGFTQGSGTIVNGVTSNPYTISGLTPRTDYDFYVQTDCGASGGSGTSNWVGPYTWTQPDNGDTCNTPIMGTLVQDCSQATPLTLDFANAISEYLSSCDGYGNYGYWVKITWPASGSLIVNNSGTNIGLTILDACGGNELYCNNNSLASTTSLQVASAGTDVWMYFWRDDQSGTADICLQEESCPLPSDLSVDNLTTTSADLSWTENGSATTWNIEYGLSGFSQGAGTVISGITSNPYTLTGLSPNTLYDFYVQSDCGASGGTGTSNWVGPYTFSTSPVCGDTFYDDGGASGDYSANLNQSFTIYPDNTGDAVSVTFNSFDTEEGWDGMMVYNGVDTSAPIFDSGSTYGRPTCPDGAWTGAPGDTYTADGHTFTSTDASGALTFVFTTDSSGQHAGWEAVVSCVPQAISENQIAGFKFYPNPVNHTLNLSAKNNIEVISISNVMGQEVLRMSPNVTETKVDMSQLQNGIYFVKAQVNGELTAFKVIKK